MRCNVGKTDRIIRAILGVLLLGLAFGLKVGGAAQTVLVVLGIVLLLTAALGFCLLYLPFGINTCRRE
ncbi:MAG: DUF2892 domain-containing protein [Thermotogae bacterium]|nr:DUF2892 domain-containing protein [Thermotogota bacterium]